MATILLGVKTLLKMTNSLGVTISLARVACFIKNTYVKGASTKDINNKIAKNTNVGGLWVEDACIDIPYTKSGNLISGDGYICISAHKPSKSFVWGSRLLAELISEMPINSSFCSQVNQNKVL